MFTLFKCISGGISWHEVLVPFAARQPVFIAVFGAYVWFTYFVTLNVITGVFCSNACAAAESDPDMIAIGVNMNKMKWQNHAERLFKVMDADASGFITIREFESRMDDPEVQGLLLS